MLSMVKEKNLYREKINFKIKNVCNVAQSDVAMYFKILFLFLQYFYKAPLSTFFMSHVVRAKFMFDRFSICFAFIFHANIADCQTSIHFYLLV